VPPTDNLFIFWGDFATFFPDTGSVLYPPHCLRSCSSLFTGGLSFCCQSLSPIFCFLCVSHSNNGYLPLTLFGVFSLRAPLVFPANTASRCFCFSTLLFSFISSSFFFFRFLGPLSSNSWSTNPRALIHGLFAFVDRELPTFPVTSVPRPARFFRWHHFRLSIDRFRLFFICLFFGSY